MPTRRDYSAIAEQAVAANRPLVALEFHPAAVATLDAFIDVTWGDEGLAPGDELWQPGPARGNAIVSLGAFFGELMRRQFGGEWQDDPAQPDNVFAARVVLKTGLQAFPISKVYRRLRDGAPDRLEPLYLLLRRELGSTPAPAEADGWLRQARHFAGVRRHDLAGAFCDRALSLSPRPAQRAEIETLKAASVAAIEAGKLEARARAGEESRATLTRLAGEGREALAALGVKVEHGALTLFGMDTFLDETFGTGVVPGERRRPGLERALGAFLGALLCARYRGQWREQPPEALERSQVVWPSGLATCPFDVLKRRLVKGSPGVLEQVAPLVKSLCEQGDAEDPPEDPAAWFAQAEAYAADGRHLELAARVGKVAVGFPGGDTAPRRLALARWWRALGRVGEAKVHAAAGLELDLRSPALGREWDVLEAAKPLADAAGLLAQGQHAAALDAFEKALSLDPASPGGLLGKARALLGLGRAAEARPWLEGFVGRSDCEPERTYLAGVAADAAGEAVAAHEAFDRVKDHKHLPTESRAHAAARAGALAGDPRVRMARIEAIPDLETAVSAYAGFCADHPGHAEAWREQGVGLAMMGRTDEALECLRRAAWLEPGEPKSYDHEAVTLAQAKRLDEALAALDRGLRACPGSGTLHARRGAFLAMQGRHEEALRACDEALAADPGYADAWAFKGDVEARLGRTADAIASLERYLAAKPGSREKRAEVVRRQLFGLRHPGRDLDRARALDLEARAIQKALAGAVPESLALLGEAVAVDPTLETAWFNRAADLRQMSRFEEALSSLARAEELGGPTGPVADATAACCLKLGRGDAAIAAYDRLLARQPRSPEGLRGKARTLAGLGRPAEALPLYDRLLARSPADEDLVRERAEAQRALRRGGAGPADER